MEETPSAASTSKVSSGRVAKVYHRTQTQKILNDKIMTLIVNKNLPMSVVDGEEFEDIIHSKSFLYKLNSNYFEDHLPLVLSSEI